MALCAALYMGTHALLSLTLRRHLLGYFLGRLSYNGKKKRVYMACMHALACLFAARISSPNGNQVLISSHPHNAN